MAAVIDTARRQGARVARGLLRRGREGAGAAADGVRRVRRAADDSGESPVAVAGRALALRRARGFTLAEAEALGLLVPSPGPDAGRHVSKRETLRAQLAANPEELEALTEDKAVFYRLAEAAGLPVPATYAVLCGSGAGSTRDGRPLAGPADQARFLREEAPPEFVVKPAWGYHGLGVRLVERRGRELVLRGGETVDAEELCRRLAADRRFRTHLVQERLRNHPDVPGPPDVLATVRVMTLVGHDGGVRALAAVMRLAVGDAEVDNFRTGTTGNLIAEVAVADGRLGPPVGVDDRGRFVPLVGGDLPYTPEEGRRLPGWGAVLELVHAAAPAFLPMRTLGWDVAMTPAGPVLVEANMWWDPICPLGDMAAIVEAVRGG